MFHRFGQYRLTLAALVIASLLAVGGALSLTMDSRGSRQAEVSTVEIMSTSPQELVTLSDTIVVATFVKSLPTELVVDRGSAAVAVAEANRYEVSVKMFTVETVVRGTDIRVASTIETRTTTRLWAPKSETGSSAPVLKYADDVRLRQGEPYVVFTASYVDQAGVLRYGSHGTANIAAVRDGQLTFLASTGYLNKLVRHGLPRSLPSAFEGVDLGSLRALVELDDEARAAAAARPNPDGPRSTFERRLAQFLGALPLLATARDVESEAARLGLRGHAPNGAAPGLCLKLEGFVLTTRGFVVDLCGDGP